MRVSSAGTAFQRSDQGQKIKFCSIGKLLYKGPTSRVLDLRNTDCQNPVDQSTYMFCDNEKNY